MSSLDTRGELIRQRDRGVEIRMDDIHAKRSAPLGVEETLATMVDKPPSTNTHTHIYIQPERQGCLEDNGLPACLGFWLYFPTIISKVTPFPSEDF